MAPIVAIFATLLLAAIAIATDLSVTTHYKRALQNGTDSAALAGAALLPTTPSSGSGSDQAKATATALHVLHNAYQFTAPGPNWYTNWANLHCDSPNTVGCSITVCAGLTAPSGCDEIESAGSATPSWFTINTPPKNATITGYNGNVHYMEVYGSQRAGAFLGGVIGFPTASDAAESVAFHYAAGQPFPFGLYSKTIVQSGNSDEVIYGNVYADRQLVPQSTGAGGAGICAAPVNGVNSYIVLGYPQQDDGSAYTGGGQGSISGHPNADPLQGGATCPASSGFVAMTGTPSATNCKNAFNIPGSPIGYDAADNACEANPSISPPAVAPLPNLPIYPASKQFGCGSQPGGSGLQGGSYQPGEYKCTSGAALNVDQTLVGGIYEIDAGGTSCDVNISTAQPNLQGVTFYLKGSVQICVAETPGANIVQTPADTTGCKDPGDCRYVYDTDGSGTPQITLSKTGSSPGAYQLTGVIWMPNGNVNNANKAIIEVNGQAIVSTWTDKSGKHTNPSVTYNGAFAPPQNERLQLAE
jgi:hypothetical protein